MVSINYCYSQQQICDTKDNVKDSAVPSCNMLDGESCPYDDAPILYVEMVFHFILKPDGTGNFNEVNDGDPKGPTNYSGYDHAENLVNEMNREMENIDLLWGPYKDKLPPCKLNIRIVLKGVYFHRMNDVNPLDYNTSSLPNYDPNSYNLKINRVVSSKGFTGPYGETSYGVNTARVSNVWNLYLDDKPNLKPDDLATGANYGTFIICRTALHELFHTPGLYHPQGGDICDDTYKFPYDCWQWVPNKPPCDDWNNISNNLLDYNPYRKWSLSPCQICTIYESFSGQAQQYNQDDVVTKVGGCAPATAFSTLASSFCVKSGQNYNKIILYAGASSNETAYKIDIFETNAVGSNINLGGTYSTTFIGQAGQINLASLYSFKPNNIYRVKLSVSNECSSSESIQYIHIKGCRFVGDPSEVNDGEVESFKIAPNPTIGTIRMHYTLRETTPVDIELLDPTTGITLKQTESIEEENEGEHSQFFNVEDLPSGQYFIKVSTNKYISIHRVEVLAD